MNVYNIDEIKAYIEKWQNRTSEQIKQDDVNWKNPRYCSLFKKEITTGADLNKQD